MKLIHREQHSTKFSDRSAFVSSSSGNRGASPEKVSIPQYGVTSNPGTVVEKDILQLYMSSYGQEAKEGFRKRGLPNLISQSHLTFVISADKDYQGNGSGIFAYWTIARNQIPSSTEQFTLSLGPIKMGPGGDLDEQLISSLSNLSIAPQKGTGLQPEFRIKVQGQELNEIPPTNVSFSKKYSGHFFNR